MMKKKYTVLILTLFLLFLDFLLLKNPIAEYFKIKTGNNEQLTKLLIRGKYIDLWHNQAFSLTGENLKREDSLMTLENNQLRVLNWPFSKTSYTPLFKLLYKQEWPYISVSFHLNDKEIVYFYQQTLDSDYRYVSISGEEDNAFVEKTGRMSVNDMRKDIKTYEDNFLNGLHGVKNERLKKLRSIVTFHFIFFSIINVLIFRLMSRKNK